MGGSSVAGDVAAVVATMEWKAKRALFAGRATRVLSSVRVGVPSEKGDLLVLIAEGGGFLVPWSLIEDIDPPAERGCAFGFVAIGDVPNLGISLTIGEYCDIGEEPLYAPACCLTGLESWFV